MERTKKLIDILAEKEGFATRNELASLLDVSPSTVRDEILAIENLVEKYDCKIIRVRGSGVRLEGNKNNIAKLKNEINGINSEENRIHLLAYYLLTYRNDFIRIEDLSNKFYLSRSTIQKELPKLDLWFKNRNIVLHKYKGKGIKLLGKEQDMRSAFSELVSYQTNILDPYGFKSSYKSIQENIATFLSIDVSPINVELNKTLDLLGIKLSENSKNTLLLHIAISIARIRQGKSLKCELNEKVNYKYIYEKIITMCVNLGKIYGIIFSKEEIYLIYEYVISSNDVIGYSTDESEVSLHEKCSDLAGEIINVVQDTRRIIISNETIYEGLVLHLIPLVHRMLNKVSLKNPLLEQIKKEYPDAFGISWMTNSLFKKYFNQLLNEDELGYLTIHIESMIEQQEPRIKTLIICSHGIGISQLLISRIQNSFRKIEIVDVIAHDSLNDQKLHGIELLISTYPIENNKIPTLVVSPLLLKKDMDCIQEFVENYSNYCTKLFNLIPLETELNCYVENQNELINKIFKKLYNQNYVKEDYLKNIFDRENKCSTSIGGYTAIPHASPSMVNRSVICLVTLEKMIKWGTEDVELVIFLAIRNEDIPVINKKLRKFYQLLYQDDYHHRIMNAKRQDEVLEILDL